MDVQGGEMQEEMTPAKFEQYPTSRCAMFIDLSRPSRKAVAWFK